MFFRQLFDEKLAQYAYVVGCQKTGDALVVDPERDIDRYLTVAEEEGLEITAVAETHIHADFLSGARELAERVGARVYLSDEGDDDWKYEWVKGDDYDATLLRHGDLFHVGSVEIEALHTPGHTPEHLSFLVTDRGGGATEPMGVASGDFVFVNSLGRPDLLESAARMEGMMEPSARLLFASVRDFVELPDYLQVWPGHGAGSACGKALGAVPETTVGYEKRYNPGIAAAREGEDAFVDFILEGQPEPPLYFARMKRMNRSGPPILGHIPSPRRLTVGEVEELVADGDALVIDTRLDRPGVMARHLPGSIHCELNRSFNTAVGSLVEDETTPIHLVVEDDRLDEAVRDLVRIGYDDLRGYIEPETLERYFEDGGRVGTISTLDFDEMEAAMASDDAVVLDVRFASEYGVGHVEGALNQSYTRLPERHAELPRDRTLLVHCASGNRAASAATYLARSGYDVALVNDDVEEYLARRAGAETPSNEAGAGV